MAIYIENLASLCQSLHGASHTVPYYSTNALTFYNVIALLSCQALDHLTLSAFDATPIFCHNRLIIFCQFVNFASKTVLRMRGWMILCENQVIATSVTDA